MRELHIIQSGSIPYQDALNFQEELVQIKAQETSTPDVLWLLSHPPVITVGARRDARKNLLQTDGVEVVSITRGGDVTYHDEGQITGYLLSLLENQERDLHRILKILETAVIEALMPDAHPNDQLHTVEGKTGVFLNDSKVCSIGIACRRWVTFHGFSLCFTSDPKAWFRLNPCGLDPMVMKNLPGHFSRPHFEERIGNLLAAHLKRELSPQKWASREEFASRFMRAPGPSC